MISLALVVITLFHVDQDTTHFEDQHVAKTLHQYNFYIGTVKFVHMVKFRLPCFQRSLTHGNDDTNCNYSHVEFSISSFRITTFHVVNL